MSSGDLRAPLFCDSMSGSPMGFIRWDSTDRGNIEFKSAGLRGLRPALQDSKTGSKVRRPTLKEFGAVTIGDHGGGHGAGVA